MPIYESAGSTLIHFGYGDVVIALGRAEDCRVEDEIVLFADLVHPIGETRNDHEGETSESLKAPVRLKFDKPESVVVMIEQLERIKANLLAAGASS